MKKILHIMCMCVLALGLLSGCGGEFAEEMEAGKDASRALTGQAVSGQSVSGQSIQTDGEEADSAREDFGKALDSRYCTERYYYISSYDEEEGPYIAQISLETGKEKRIWVKELDQVIYVEKDALYYTRSMDDEEEYYGLWRLPIERREDGTEKLNLDRTEQVKGLDDIYYEDDTIYMDDQYIIYSGIKGDEEDTDVICYDRESGRKASLPASDRVQDCLECDIESIYRRNDRIDLVTTGGIVTWDVRTGDVTVCGDDVLDDEGELVSTEDVCFYTKGYDQPAILRIDMKTKEKTEFVPEEELLATLEKEVGISKKKMKEDRVYVDSVYYDEHHLYMEIRVLYEKEGKTGCQSIILSREDAEGASLQYEKGLTEYLWDGNGTKDLNTEYEFISSNASCYGISRGRAYIKCWSEDDRVWDDIIYDLKTGKTRPASWKDDLIFE